MITSFDNPHNMYRMNRPMGVVSVPRGIILPQKKVQDGPMWGLGGVCDADNHFVDLSAYDGGWATHGGIYSWENEEYCDCDVVYFGMFFNHWGHFLIDLIGRLWFFTEKYDHDKKRKLVYLGEEEPQRNFLEFFSLLGIAEEDLIHVTVPTRFRSVVVPEFSCKSCVWYSDEYRRIFDVMIAKVQQENYESERLKNIDKVYLSRRAFGKALQSEFGESTIITWLESNGFMAIAPENLSVREQIYVWNRAKEIACLNGSIPMGMAFCANEQLKLTVLNKTHLEHLNLELFLLMRPCDVTLLDVWYEPFKRYPKSIGAGPFLFYLGEDAQSYSEKRGWGFPFSEKQLLRERRVNMVQLMWCILNFRWRFRALLSKMIPQKIKNILRGR